MLPSVFCELYLAHMNTFPSLSITKYHFRFISSGARKAEGRPSEASWIFFCHVFLFLVNFSDTVCNFGSELFSYSVVLKGLEKSESRGRFREAVAGSVAAASKANAPRAAASNNQGRSLSSFWWEQEEQFWQEEKEKKAWKKFLLTLSKLTYTTGPMGQFFIADERIVKMVLNNSIYMRFAL